MRYSTKKNLHLEIVVKTTYFPDLTPTQTLEKAIEVGKQKCQVNTTTTIARSFIAGSLLGVAAVFAISIGFQTGYPIVGAILFPVGFCLIYLFGGDLLTGVFVLLPLAWFNSKKSLKFHSILKNWGLVFLGNFIGAFTIAVFTCIFFTSGFSVAPTELGQHIAEIGENRTVGYKEHGMAGMLTVFSRAILCNWMVSLAVLGSLLAGSIPGKILIMWMPIMLFFAMGFEHSIVNMYLFPTALMLNGGFSISDYLLWNELPVILGNLVGGILLTALPLQLAHISNHKNLHKD